MADMDDEQGWVRQSLQGDHEAFAALVRRYQRMIHALTFRMTGSLADAEDLAQETFIQAFRQLASYRAEAKLSSWIYRIAVNLCLNWQQRERRRNRLHSDWGQQQEPESRSDLGRMREIQEALMKLHPKQRAAMILTTYDGLNHAEAAKVLGCSETTVSWRLFAARARLRKMLTRSTPAKSPEAQHD